MMKRLMAALIVLSLAVLAHNAFAQEAHEVPAAAEGHEPGAGAPAEAHAAQGEHGTGASHEVPHEIPKSVYHQAFNVGLLILLLGVLLKSKVGDFFSGRHDKLASAVQEARRAQEEAERRHAEYKMKIETLEKQSDQQLEAIRKEGEDYRKKLIEESKQMALAIEAEAKKSALNEIEKAKAQLREEVVAQALQLARKALSEGVADKDQQRLQQEFVAKIQAVSR